jgi:AcrR family transcriptional regulator
MQKQSYKEQEKQRRESEILRVAGQMLSERGYLALNMDEVAEVVGISKPTLYQHFKGKDELVCQVIAGKMEGLSSFIFDTNEGTPLERIVKMMRTMMKGRSMTTGLWSAMNVEAVWKAFKGNEILIQQRRKFGEKVSDLVDEAKAAGEISESLPTTLVVRLIFGVQMSLTDPHHPGAENLTEQDIDATIESLITVFLHGVTP